MPRWTPEARARQAELIRRWAPWGGSTGPKSNAGKAKVARNADKGKAALRLKCRRLRAEAKWCFRQLDLDAREKADFERAVTTGNFDSWNKMHGNSA